MSIEERLTELGIVLPTPAAPLANYVPYTREGKLLIVSGQLPMGPDGKLAYTGKLGGEVSLEDGAAAARLCAINCLAQVKAAAGGLDAVRQVLRLGGFVNCTADFQQQPQVINGASDLMVEVFGDKGRHARAAVGSIALPFGAAVEVEMMVALE
ncbi:MAG: RidA family protein [SAR324 cluster bacterium]|nr:RidA family protein [SAR324 cluster bacterium]